MSKTVLSRKAVYVGMGFALFWLFTSVIPVLGSNPQSAVSVHDGLFVINAQAIALGDLLREISDKTGLLVENDIELTQPVSVAWRGLDLEEVLKRLLAEYDYSMAFTKKQDGSFQPETLRILSDKKALARQQTDFSGQVEPFVGAGLRGNAPNGISAVSDQIIKQMNLALQDTEALEDMVSFMVVKGHHLTGGVDSIMITRLAGASIFYQIGLRAGDMILDVNGKQIRDAANFVKLLNGVLEKKESHIRIDRVNNQGEHAPLYVTL